MLSVGFYVRYRIAHMDQSGNCAQKNFILCYGLFMCRLKMLIQSRRKTNKIQFNLNLNRKKENQRTFAEAKE